MSVLKNLQRLSNMEFYKNAMDIRNAINEFILRDFGTKHEVYNIKVFSDKISNYDKNKIYQILDPYEIMDHKVFGKALPDWFFDGERNDLRSLSKELLNHIIDANEVYVHRECDFNRRRDLQSDAASCCYKIYSQFEYMKKFVPIDLNHLNDIFEMLDKEIDLLHSWKSSDAEAWNNKKKRKK